MSVNPDTGLEEDPSVPPWAQVAPGAQVPGQTYKNGIPQVTWTQPQAPTGAFAGQTPFAQAPPTPPATVPPPGAGGPPSGASDWSGAQTGLLAPFTGQFQAPSPIDLGGPAGIPYVPPTPQFQPPTYTKPPAFSYADFQMPTLAEAQNSPGYQFRVQQGRGQLEASQSARGIINSLGAAKDLEDYGQNAASQEYQSVFNRDYSTYGMNRSNALDSYNTNYGTQYVDPYKFQYQSAVDALAPQMAGWQAQANAGANQTAMNYGNAWTQFLNSEDLFRDQRDSTYNKMLGYATA